MRWRILHKERADKLGLRLLKAGSETFLEISLVNIPLGMSVPDFVNYIQRTGIVINGNYNKPRKRRKR